MKYNSKVRVKYLKVNKKCKADQDKLDYLQKEYMKIKKYMQDLEERNIYYNIESLPELIRRNMKVKIEEEGKGKWKEEEEGLSSMVKMYEKNLYENKRYYKHIHSYLKIDIEQQKINQDNLCLKCRINLIDLILIPCGHAVICSNCLTSLCFYCKEEVLSLAKITLSDPIH